MKFQSPLYSQLFFVLAVIVRLIQGVGSACVQVAGKHTFISPKHPLVFSIVAIEYPLEKIVYFGYCESATGIGLMAGPIVG